MEYSRVVKFKDYRDSFTKENSVKIDTKKSDDYMSSTTTLPYEEVIKEVNSRDEIQENIKKARFKRIYLMCLLGVISVGVIMALVFLGILAFRG